MTTLGTREFHGMTDQQYGQVVGHWKEPVRRPWDEPVIDIGTRLTGHWEETGRELRPEHIVTHSRRLLYRFRIHFHPYAERLVRELVAADIDGLERLDTRRPELREVFFENRYKPRTSIALRSIADFPNDPAAVLSKEVRADGTVARDLIPVKELDFDYAEGAYAVYNWELFYHVPYTIALHLSKNGRYADARRWFHYIFNPTDNSDGPVPQRYWQVRPFRIDEVEHVEETLFNLSTGDDPGLQERTISAIAAWRSKPFRPHLVARTRPSAYMYATVMAYLDNLIAWGDSLFRQDTRESINEAMTYYVLAANVLGPSPQAIPRKGKLRKETYESLRNDLDEFGNAARDLEAEIPFDLLGPGTPTSGTPSDAPLESLGRSLYFGIPRNDKLLEYWSTVGDRLYKIRNSLNLQGIFRQLPLFAPPIDPAMLARAIAAGVDVASIVAGAEAPLTPVRFQVMLQKAIEICQEVKGLGAQILAAIEKKDNEALSVLRAKHESNLLSLGGSVRYAQWQEAVKNREGTFITLSNTFQRFRHYDRLLGTDPKSIKLPDHDALDTASLENRRFSSNEPTVEGPEATVDIGENFRDGGHKISSSEAHELLMLEITQVVQDAATVLDGIGAFLNLVPEFTGQVSPLGVGAAARFGGSNLGRLFQGLAGVTRGVGGRLQHEASLAGKMAGFDRREQDWAYQRMLAAGEVTQLYKQFRAAELREHIAKREYDNHKQQLAQAQDVEDFLVNEKRKTTTQDFYVWMRREAQALHAQCFQFAYDVAKKAERALQHELGNPAASYITAGYTAGREGLFAGEKLYLDLRRMEMAHAELNAREFEITKQISLRDWFPVQLVELRATGRCEIDISEALFDLDCPGHIYRRIKSMAASIPCVAGPYASINCSLMLLGNTVRTGATKVDNKWYPTDPTNPDTTRFATYTVAKDSIVTSGAQADTGTFEGALRDERYLPFEGGGAISKWAIELLGKPHQFDYDTIADVVLTMRYTARPGAAPDMVTPEVKTWLQNNSATVFSMRHDFPSEWARFKRVQPTTGQQAKLAFELTAEHFPYRMQEAFTNAKRLHLFTTSTGQIQAELYRGTTSIGTTTLADGEGEIVPAPRNNQPGSFDPRGTFELRFDTAALDDLWIVVDWSGPTA